MPLSIIGPMQNLRFLVMKHFALSIVFLFLFGCSSIALESGANSDEILNIQQNFKIDGKFKVSFMDSKETGYFELDKYNNTISLTLGKNYLLPEEVLILDIRENLNLNQFSLEKNLINEINEIPIKYLIELCLGLNVIDQQIDGISINLEYNNLNKEPSNVIIASEVFELTILIKKIWKN